MGRKCNVPHCTSGYSSNPEKVSIFSTPKDDNLLAKWNAAISRIDRALTKKDFVCEKHFTPDDIMKEWTCAANIITIALNRPRLKKDAVPSIFPRCLRKIKQKGNQNNKFGKQANKKTGRSRLPTTESPEFIPVYIKEEIDLSLESSIGIAIENEVINEQSEENCNSNEESETFPPDNHDNQNIENVEPMTSPNIFIESVLPVPPESIEKEPERQVDILISTEEGTAPENFVDSNENNQKNLESPVASTSESVETLNSQKDTTCFEIQQSETSGDASNIFNIIWNGSLKPPNEFWSFVRIKNAEKFVSFGKFILSANGLPFAERQVLVKWDLTTKYLLNNNALESNILPGIIQSIDELEEVLICVNSLKLCIGGPSIEKYSPDLYRKYRKKKYVDTFSKVWRHTECTIIITEGARKRCIFCNIVANSLATITRRMKKKRNPKRDSINKSKCIRRLRVKVDKLRNHIKELKQKMSVVEKTSITEKLKQINLPETQQLLIMQCIDRSKVQNPRSMKFHKNWLQLCLLIYEKNKAVYKFLKDTEILPLPCRRTMHRYLSGDIKRRET